MLVLPPHKVLQILVMNLLYYGIGNKYRILLWPLDFIGGTWATGFNSHQPCKFCESEKSLQKDKTLQIFLLRISLWFSSMWSLDPTLLLCCFTLLSLRYNVIVFSAPCPRQGKVMSPLGGHEVGYMLVYLCSSQSHHFPTHHTAVMWLEVELYCRACARWCFPEGKATGRLGKRWCNLGGWLFLLTWPHHPPASL